MLSAAYARSLILAPPNPARLVRTDLGPVSLPKSGSTLSSACPPEGRGKAAQFIPIRFVFNNKLAKDDRLLLAFDAFVLSTALGRQIDTGKIIHGDDYATIKVKIPNLLV